MSNVKPLRPWVVKGFHKGTEVYYTGRAGDGWLSEDLKEAFEYESENAALYRVDLFNSRTILHGVHFDAKEKS